MSVFRLAFNPFSRKEHGWHVSDLGYREIGAALDAEKLVQQWPWIIGSGVHVWQPYSEPNEAATM